MALYESTYIARHDMSTQQIEGLAETMANLVREHGGEVTKTEHWGLKTLAYRIKKNRKGHYVFFNIDAPAETIAELERNLRLNEDILRYLTIRVDEHETEPSAMLRARAGRDDRGRRGGFGRPPRPREGEGRPREDAKPGEGTKPGESTPGATTKDTAPASAATDVKADDAKAGDSA